MEAKLKQDISIGENLQRLRKQANLSQSDVARLLQLDPRLSDIAISREIISQMEAGKYSIRISVLLTLKDLYHVSSMDEFFEGL